MPSRRGIAYDELLGSFCEELRKAKTKVVVCLDEVDQLTESTLIYDLARARSNGIPMQIIAISNDPFVFDNIDPRARSSLFPLEEIAFNPYSKKEMVEIIKERVDAAFKQGMVVKEAIDYLAEFTAERKDDVRIARETLLRAGDLARKSGGKVELRYIKEILGKTKHAKTAATLSALSRRGAIHPRTHPGPRHPLPATLRFLQNHGRRARRPHVSQLRGKVRKIEAY